MSDAMSQMIGKIFTRIDNEGTSITFYCEDGGTFRMYHEQDCCESVRVEDIAGDLDDLIGYPIRSAYESTSQARGDYESATWTFYHLRTQEGSVCIRWLGESNGYYSESVTVDYTPGEPEDSPLDPDTLEWAYEQMVRDLGPQKLRRLAAWLDDENYAPGRLADARRPRRPCSLSHLC